MIQDLIQVISIVLARSTEWNILSHTMFFFENGNSIVSKHRDAADLLGLSFNVYYILVYKFKLSIHRLELPFGVVVRNMSFDELYSTTHPAPSQELSGQVWLANGRFVAPLNIREAWDAMFAKKDPQCLSFMGCSYFWWHVGWGKNELSVSLAPRRKKPPNSTGI